MAGKVIDVTDADFSEKLKAADKPVLLDFWAPWCTPCQMTQPVIEKISEDMADKITVMAINVDENPNTPNSYNVLSIPTMYLVINGQVKNQFMGALSESVLKAKIEDTLNGDNT
jgi:thioredoxin 1